MEQYLESLLLSLNSIEVRGKDNLNVLLGCILAVEAAIANLDKPEEESENGG